MYSIYRRGTSSAPVNITNSIGRIALYQNGSFYEGPGGLGAFKMRLGMCSYADCLCADDPLAANFSVRTGKEPVTIPVGVTPGIYSIVCE